MPLGAEPARARHDESLARREGGERPGGSGLQQPREQLGLRRPVPHSNFNGPADRSGASEDRKMAPDRVNRRSILRATTMIQRRTKHALGLTAVAVGLFLAPQGFNSTIVDAQRVRFFADDPLSREPDTQDASKVETMEVGLSSDLLLNLFTQVGDRRTNVKAQNINTID